ncbi:MAG: hypothetical protein ACK5B3_04730, partial [Bacteroidota bacterium]
MNHLKLYLIVIAVFAFFNSTLAQDECSTATTITPGATCSYTTFDLPGTLTKSTNNLTGCSAASLVDDAWAKFTATGTSSTVRYQNTSRDAGIWI